MTAFSYHRTLATARSTLEHTIDRNYIEIVTLLNNAEESLNLIASRIDKDEPILVDTLAQIVYDHPLFREATVIDGNGFLTVTNTGVVDPPRRVAEDLRSDPTGPGLQLLGPRRTMVMGRHSIIMSQPTPDGGEVNLLVDPGILLYFVDQVDEVSLGPDGFIAFVQREGRVIAVDGMPPPDGRLVTEDSEPGRLRVVKTTPGGEVTIVGEISRDWVLSHWVHVATLSVPLAVLGIGALVSMFLYFLRRVEALDFELQAGLDNDEFELHYQPIVDITTGQCIGSEALVRWRHPEQGMLQPGVFVPSAEKTGIITAISDWVMRRAVMEQAELFEQYPNIYLALNLSPVQLNTGAVDDVINWLQTEPLANERLVFEITESSILHDSQTTAIDAIARLRSMGCKVALDDFGTGYSSLSYLHKFEFDYLKIDLQFVRGIDRDIRTNSILEAMTKMGHVLGVKMVAEGVESEEQRRFLQNIHVPYAQGWLYSRPLPIREYVTYLRKNLSSAETGAC